MKSLFFLFLLNIPLYLGAEPKIVGYYTGWAQFREGSAKCMPEDIDGSLLTHVNYAFARFDRNGMVQPKEHNDFDTAKQPGMYQRFNNLKKKHKHLKTLISVGGATVGSASFSDVLCCKEKRGNLARSLVKFAKERGFDGVDIDWEYEKPTSKKNDECELLVKLLKEMREVANQLKYKNFLISVVVGTCSVAHDADCLTYVAELADWLNLIGYDFHGSWDNYTGTNAPLNSDNTKDSEYYIDKLVKQYLDRGISAKKIVLGIPSYGRSYGGVEAKGTELLGKKSNGPGSQGKYTKQDGILAYFEIKDLKSDYIQSWNYITDTPFIYNKNKKEFITFDNEKSVKKKAEYAKDKKLGGAMLWALPLDDFKNGYPLLKSIRLGLKGDDNVNQ